MGFQVGWMEFGDGLGDLEDWLTYSFPSPHLFSSLPAGALHPQQAQASRMPTAGTWTRSRSRAGETAAVQWRLLRRQPAAAPPCSCKVLRGRSTGAGARLQVRAPPFTTRSWHRCERCCGCVTPNGARMLILMTEQFLQDPAPGPVAQQAPA